MSSLKKPSVATLDIEASGIHAESYPIEVGLVLPNGDSYCSLIKPAGKWTHWNTDAEKIHGISQAELEEFGKEPIEVAGKLNQLLKNYSAYSDCWVLDNPWLVKLFQQAAIEQTFQLRDISYILDEAEQEQLNQEKEAIFTELHLKRHRATNDARILQLGYQRIINNRRFSDS